MATTTAWIEIGKSHPNDGGLIQSLGMVQLSEGDKPVWSCQSNGVNDRLIPESPESILIAGLASAVGWLVKDPLMINAVKEATVEVAPKVRSIRPPNNSEPLAGALQQCDFNTSRTWKVVLSVLSQSSVLTQVDIVKNYSFPCEVLTPTFGRGYSRWAQ